MTSLAEQSSDRERDGRDQQEAPRLVWTETVLSWCWETSCGQYRIERYIPGEYQFIGRYAAPERFRVLKLNPYWWGEISGSETDIETCQSICEDNARL